MSINAQDRRVEEIISGDPNMLVPWYLIASYAYYVLDDPVISDDLYDRVCFLLAEELDAVNIDHMHAHMCDPEALRAGTGFHVTKYPSRVVNVTQKILDERL